MLENPYSAENRHSINLLAYLIHKSQAKRLRIATTSGEMAKAMVRSLCWQAYIFLVETAGIQETIASELGISTQLRRGDGPPADAAVFPFSYPESLRPEKEPAIFVACQNAFSYKSLLYPGMVKRSIFKDLAGLRQEYALASFAGLYPPVFIVWWSLAKLVERWSSAWYFRLEDLAMQRLVHFGLWWRLSYLVVFAGRLKN